MPPGSTHITQYKSTRLDRSYEVKPTVCMHYPYKQLWNNKWIEAYNCKQDINWQVGSYTSVIVTPWRCQTGA